VFLCLYLINTGYYAAAEREVDIHSKNLPSSSIDDYNTIIINTNKNIGPLNKEYVISD